jgi:hypothetical protein
LVTWLRTIASTAASTSPPLSPQRRVGLVGGRVEPALAVDPEVEDVLDELGGLAVQDPLVRGAVLSQLERAPDVLDRIARTVPTLAGKCHVVLLETPRRCPCGALASTVHPATRMCATGRD